MDALFVAEAPVCSATGQEESVGMKTTAIWSISAPVVWSLYLFCREAPPQVMSLCVMPPLSMTVCITLKCFFHMKYLFLYWGRGVSIFHHKCMMKLNINMNFELLFAWFGLLTRA